METVKNVDQSDNGPPRLLIVDRLVGNMTPNVTYTKCRLMLVYS